MASLTLLHTNDLHGKLSPAKMPLLLNLRKKADLYFDTGDCIKAGNLAVPLKPEAAWGLLGEASCDASVPGNRESHPLAKGVRAKFAGVRQPVLCANWHDKNGAPAFPASKVFTLSNGLRVAVFGVMVPMVTAAMATRGASQYLWDAPVPCAVEVAAKLRTDADFVVALTHIGLSQDKKLAEATDDIDLILGGHSHTVLEKPLVVGNTPICQGGSHARFIGRYVLEAGKGLKKAELVPWP